MREASRFASLALPLPATLDPLMRDAPNEAWPLANADKVEGHS
jgi:hypothetical protein